MTTLSRRLLAGGLLSAAASVLVALPSASPASAAVMIRPWVIPSTRTCSSIPTCTSNYQAKSEAEGGGPNVIDYLNRHPDVRQHLIDLSQQCALVVR